MVKELRRALTERKFHFCGGGPETISKMQVHTMPIKEIHEIRAELKAIETRLLYLAYHLTLSGRLAPQSLLDLDVASMLDAMHTMGVGSTNAIDKVLRDLEARHGECSLPPLWLAWAQIEGKDRLEQLREAL